MAHSFIPAPDCVRLEMVYSYNGNICENVFHFRHTHPATVGDMVQDAFLMREWWNNWGKPLFNVTSYLKEIKVTALDSENAPGITYNDGMPSLGEELIIENLPANVTAAVKFTTGLRGRSYRGRIYHVGLLPLHVTGNQLTGLAAIHLEEMYDPISLGLGADHDPRMVVVSYMAHGAWRTVAEATNVISSETNVDLDSQRRRLNTRGQ